MPEIYVETYPNPFSAECEHLANVKSFPLKKRRKASHTETGACLVVDRRTACPISLPDVSCGCQAEPEGKLQVAVYLAEVQSRAFLETSWQLQRWTSLCWRIALHQQQLQKA